MPEITWGDLADLVTAFSLLAGGVWALFRYFEERRKDREQRADELIQRTEELRWQRAQAAKGLMDEFLDDPHSGHAMLMLDSWSRVHDVPSLGHTVIHAQDWLSALGAATPSQDVSTAPIDLYVRDAFDNFFYYMALFEHYIDKGFVLLEDISFPVDYYAVILAQDKQIYQNYLGHFGPERALTFLSRFSEWQTPATPTR